MRASPVERPRVAATLPVAPPLPLAALRFPVVAGDVSRRVHPSQTIVDLLPPGKMSCDVTVAVTEKGWGPPLRPAVARDPPISGDGTAQRPWTASICRVGRSRWGLWPIRIRPREWSGRGGPPAIGRLEADASVRGRCGEPRERPRLRPTSSTQWHSGDRAVWRRNHPPPSMRPGSKRGSPGECGWPLRTGGRQPGPSGILLRPPQLPPRLLGHLGQAVLRPDRGRSEPECELPPVGPRSCGRPGRPR